MAGTTADKLAKLAATKQAIREALIDAGLSVGSNFSEYADEIRKLSLKTYGDYIPGVTISMNFRGNLDDFLVVKQDSAGTWIISKKAYASYQWQERYPYDIELGRIVDNFSTGFPTPVSDRIKLTNVQIQSAWASNYTKSAPFKIFVPSATELGFTSASFPQLGQPIQILTQNRVSENKLSYWTRSISADTSGFNANKVAYINTGGSYSFQTVPTSFAVRFMFVMDPATPQYMF